jgi:anti-anti-sigma regulatory factor
VVLDLADLDYISSAGLHAIETAGARLHARSKSLTVRGAHGVTKLSLGLAGSLANVSYPG